MGEKTRAFVKGGFGCLSVFAILALIIVLVGGRAWVDVGGVIVMFLFGGVVGLIVLAIYNRGRRAGEQTEEFDEPTDNAAAEVIAE